MSDERLAEIEAQIQYDAQDSGYERQVLDLAGELLAEVRRLRAENRLLHLSRGTAPEQG